MSNWTQEVVKVAITAFDKSASVTSFFVLPIFIGRIAYLNVSGSDSRSYTRVLKGVVLYFTMIALFDPILRFVMELPEQFLPSFDLNILNQKRLTASEGQQSISAVPSVLKWGLEACISVLYYIAIFLHFTFAVLMSALAPVVFLLGALLGVGLGIPMFFGLFVTVSSWPILFAAADELNRLVYPITGGGFAGTVFDLLIVALKILGPITIAFFGVNSAPGQAISRAVSAGVNSQRSTREHSQTAIAGLRGKSLPDQHRSRLSHVVSHRIGASVRKGCQKASSWMGRGEVSRPVPNATASGSRSNSDYRSNSDTPAYSHIKPKEV